MDALNRTLFNLKTIGGVTKGKKIGTTREYVVVEGDSILQGLFRWWASDGRDRAVEVVCREITNAAEFARLLSESKHISANADHAPSTETNQRLTDLRAIAKRLTKCVDGINNLCETYEADANTVARLRSLLGQIEIISAGIAMTLVRYTPAHFTNGTYYPDQ